MTDICVLGSGVAGLTVARVAADAGCSVVLLTKAELAASATRYAQGGVAAALGPGDSPELHFSDTVSAGGGLCDPAAVRVLCREGPARLRQLMALGAVFDRAPARLRDGLESGALDFAREGGHSLARVVHAGGDATGHEVERALVSVVTASGVGTREVWLATALLVEAGRVTGVVARTPAGTGAVVRARHVVLASGGAGQLFAVTTNPPLSTGDGVALALAAGAAVADVEFMQFHPTALALPGPTMPRPLLSEALRGEGALLRDEAGVAFMAAEHPLADLAPRDVVARAIGRRLVERGLDHLWLDATPIDGFPDRFPTIWRACRAVGLDPTRDWLPVAPAAHYLCGGVMTDLDGATTIPGLWACGEVACTGVHGANRLASNSLLEGLVFGHRVAAAIASGRDGPSPTGVLRDLPTEPPAGSSDGSSGGTSPSTVTGNGRTGRGGPATVTHRARLQAAMTTSAGVLRDAVGLADAARTLDAVGAAVAAAGPPADAAAHELANLVAVGRAVVAAAAERRESRGGHHRLDHPAADAEPVRLVHRGGRLARVPAGSPTPAPARQA